MSPDRETRTRRFQSRGTVGSLTPAGRHLMCTVLVGVFCAVGAVGCRGTVTSPCEATFRNIAPAQGLLNAIQAEDIDAVRHAIACSANPNGRVEDRPMLWYAIQRGNVIVVRELLKAGASVHARISVTEGGYPMLTVAADVDRPQIVRALLAAGADPNERSGAHKNLTALGQAAVSNQPANCEALIDAGADPNSWNMWPEADYVGHEFEPGVARGKTPLMLAAMRGNTRAVAVLLWLGADPTLRNERGETALGLTRKYESPIGYIREMLARPNVPPGLRSRN